MVKQYPHRVVFTVTSGSFRNGQGNWVEGATTMIEYKGRVEANSNGRFLSATDGTRIDFSWIVYMPLPVEEIPTGSKVEVFNSEVQICSTTLKRLSIGQLNARGWL